MFKGNIAPAWEDRANENGSQLDAMKPFSMEGADIHWQTLVFGIIGELIDNGEDHICGARAVIVKKGKTSIRFEIWLRDKSDEKANKIKAKLGELMAEPNETLKPIYQLKSEDFVIDKRGKKY